MSMKNPLTPAGIEPTTFRFVAQHLTHCATAVPEMRSTHKKISLKNLEAGRLRNSREDTLKMDLKELCQEHVDWTDVTQN